MRAAALVFLVLARPAPEGGTLEAANLPIIVVVRAGQNKIGTGLIVARNPLTIATCFHVVEREATIGVEVPYLGQSFRATHGAAWPKEDFIFLRVAGAVWPDDEPFQLRTPALGDRAFALGYAHKNRRYVTSSDELRVADPEIDVVTLAQNYAVPLSHPFRVRDFVGGVFRRGDSGGPVFDSQGRLLGLAAGRIQQPGSDDVANFAIVPSHVHTSATFVPIAQAVAADGPYGDNPIVREAVALAVTIETSSPTSLPTDAGVASVERGTCEAAIQDALTAVRRLPPPSLPADAGLSGPCQTLYERVRDTEIALRTEQEAVESLRSFASRTAEAELVAQETYAREFNEVISQQALEQRPVKSTYKQICAAMKKRSFVLHGLQKKMTCLKAEFTTVDGTVWGKATPKQFEKAAAELVRHSGYLTDERIAGRLTLPSPAVFEGIELPTAVAAMGPDGQAHAKALADASKKIRDALGTAQPNGSWDIAATVGVNAIDSDRINSSVLLNEAAQKRADSVKALTRLREELINKAAGL